MVQNQTKQTRHKKKDEGDCMAPTQALLNLLQHPVQLAYTFGASRSDRGFQATLGGQSSSFLDRKKCFC